MFWAYRRAGRKPPTRAASTEAPSRLDSLHPTRRLSSTTIVVEADRPDLLLAGQAALNTELAYIYDKQPNASPSQVRKTVSGGPSVANTGSESLR